MNTSINHFRIGLCFGISLLLSATAMSQTIDLTWNTVDGGGGSSFGSGIEISGSIGQFDAGQMSSGGITIVGGFWGGAAASVPCPGDLNSDHRVDLSDLSLLLGNYGMTGGATLGQGDVNGDGNVDLADLSALLANYGNTC